MALGSAAPRTASPLRPPRAGLLASPAARVRDIAANPSDEDRFANGYEWQTELHAPTSEFLLAMAAGCSVALPANGADDKAPMEAAYPFAIAAGDWCTAIGYEGRDYVGRARRNLEAVRSFLVAREVWYGTIAQAETLDNPWLAKAGAVEVTTAALAPEKALARLDREGMTQLFNQQFAIHCDTECIDRLLDVGSIRRDGDRWVTANETIVVADGGYLNGARDGETAGTRWMVASPIMDVLLGPIRVEGSNAPDSWVRAGMFDHAVNTVIAWAQQDVIVLNEAVLLHAAAQWDDS